MQFLFDFFFGYLIAFIGFLAPGMLNVLAAKISITESKKAAVLFVFGILTVVFIQVFTGVYFAKFLDSHPSVSQTLKQFGTVIFILLTVLFLIKGFKVKRPNNDVEIKSKQNRYVYGLMMGSFNMLAIPFFALSSLTLASKDLFDYSLPSIIVFTIGAVLGAFTIFYSYVVFFKKIQHKVDLLINNIFFILAGFTGLVALMSIYKMITS
jgi:threonine/homoserine/homoserine lactone efflux protein